MKRKRFGFTVIEVVVGIGVLLVAATILAQLATWSLSQRALADTRLEALEWATNVLENARAKEWTELTAEWAAGQELPVELAERMFQPAATVRVEPEPGRPRIKRVTVSIRWFVAEGAKAPPVDLMTLFAERSAGATR